MRKFLGTVFIVLLVFFFAGCLLVMNGVMKQFHLEKPKIASSSILLMRLNGVIVNDRNFLSNLNRYVSDSNIKGVLVRVNSPGGVVGPSQEMYAELKRVRTKLHKPVVVSVGSMAASGAYYVSLGANKIVTNPGSMVGSIGVIMEFADLQKLYKWAKIKRFVIKTGPFKDSGAEYRAMRPDEKAYFQKLVDNVLVQFKTAVANSRHLTMAQVTKLADGRVFTGAQAVKLHLADQIGTLQDAEALLGKMAGIGPNPTVFVPPPRHSPYLFDLLNTRSRVPNFNASIGSQIGSQIAFQLRDMLHTQLWGQPLMILPEAMNLLGGQ